MEVELVNESDRAVSEVVQVYLHDRAASVVRPEQRLVAAVRVDLPVGARRVASIRLHADLTAFTGRDLARIVEPGVVELRVGRSSADHVAVLEADLIGAERPVGADRVLEPEVSVEEP